MKKDKKPRKRDSSNQ